MDLENLIYRIINGYYTIYIGGSIYKVILPNLLIKHKAHTIYLKTLEDNKYDTSSWITNKNINNLLKIYNIWNEDEENKLQSLLKDLDKHKINLFKNYINLTLRTSIKNTIAVVNENISALYNKKHYFDYLTLEHYAQNIKNQYLAMNMVYNIDDTKVFDYNNFEDIDSSLLEKMIIEIYKNSIDSYMIRQIARQEIWRSFWNASKKEIFEGKIKDWTDEQRALVNFTKVLDSVREHMEAPSEEIIKDDDALDGWILCQNQKNEQEKTKKLLDQKFNLSKKNAGEVFVITQDKNERKAVNDLNDAQTKQDIKNMIKLSNQREGEINWSDLPHVRRELQQQTLQQNSRK